MNQIAKVNNGIQVAEFAHLTEKVGKWVEEYPKAKEDRFWEAISAKNAAKTEKLVVAINKTKTVSGLSDADAVRDGVISSLFSALEGYKKLPIAAKAKSAAAVLSVADKYRGIARLDLASESTQIKSLLTDLSAEAIASEIKNLDGVAEIVESLKEAEASFEEAEKSLTIGKTEGGDTASAVRKELLSVINDELVPYLNVAVRLDEETYGELAKKIAHEISEANSKVVLRAKK